MAVSARNVLSVRTTVVLPDRHARRAYAGWAILLLTAALAAVALRPATAQEEIADPVAFAETNYANNCAQCHGQDGTGGVVPDTDLQAPALAGRDDVTVPYVDLVLRTGRMPPVGDPFDNRAREVVYDDAEREAMVDWMTAEFDLEGEIPQAAEGDVAHGLEVFALNCAQCHGNAGAGGTAGQDTWTPEIDDLDPIAVVEAIRVGPFDMPAYSEDVLDSDDVNSIASYLEAVEAESGTPVFGLVELNPVFASGFVGLLAVVLLGSLLVIGGRPLSFQAEEHDPATRPLHAPTPSGQIAMTPDGEVDTPDAPRPPDDARTTEEPRSTEEPRQEQA